MNNKLGQALIGECPPEFRKFGKPEDEVNYIARCISRWRDQGHTLSDIAVVHAARWQGEQIQRALLASDIPCVWLDGKHAKRAHSPSDNKVAILTRQSSKGLEFDTVVLAGVGVLKKMRKGWIGKFGCSTWG